MYTPTPTILSALGFQVDGTFKMDGNTWCLKFGTHKYHTHTHELCYNSEMKRLGKFWLLHCSLDTTGRYSSTDFFTFDGLPQPESDEQLKALVFAFTGQQATNEKT